MRARLKPDTRAGTAASRPVVPFAAFSDAEHETCRTPAGLSCCGVAEATATDETEERRLP